MARNPLKELSLDFHTYSREEDLVGGSWVELDLDLIWLTSLGCSEFSCFFALSFFDSLSYS